MCSRILLMAVFTVALSGSSSAHGVDEESAWPFLFGRALLGEDDALYVTWIETITHGARDSTWSESIDLVFKAEQEFVIFVGDERLAPEDLQERFSGDAVNVLIVFDDSSSDRQSNPLSAQYRHIFLHEIPVVGLTLVEIIEPEDVVALEPRVSTLSAKVVQPPPLIVRHKIAWEARERGYDSISMHYTAYRPVWETRTRDIFYEQDGQLRVRQVTYQLHHKVPRRRVHWQPLYEGTYQVFRGRDRVSPEMVRYLLAGRPVLFCPVDRFLDPFYYEYLAPDTPIFYTGPPWYRSERDQCGELRYSLWECSFALGEWAPLEP